MNTTNANLGEMLYALSLGYSVDTKDILAELGVDEAEFVMEDDNHEESN